MYHHCSHLQRRKLKPRGREFVGAEEEEDRLAERGSSGLEKHGTARFSQRQHEVF